MTAAWPPRASRSSLGRVAAALLGVVLLIWSLFPVYNMLLIALSDDGDEFSGVIWPEEWNWGSFAVIWQAGEPYFRNIWRQFGNSIILGAATMTLTVLIGSLAAFALGRLRLRHAALVGDAALLTFALPPALLVIPFAHLMQVYGLSGTLWAVAAAMVAFATPCAIQILHQYGKLIPLELDEAARIDGAGPVQVYLRLYLPLMTPALIIVGLYALLLAWNEYLYQFVLLPSSGNATVALVINDFFITDEAPWNQMMALALLYALPPLMIYLGLRRFIAAGLTLGAFK